MKEKFIEWIDEQISLRDRFEEIENFSQRIETCDYPCRKKSIHLFSGIYEAAGYLGKVVSICEFDADTDKIYFTYKGYELYELCEKGCVPK